MPQYLHGDQNTVTRLSHGGVYAHLADELATEGVDDTGNGRSLALANEVEVEHTLHRLGLEAAVKGRRG